ncbi:MAG: hypothetical protein CMJ84_02390 [Planctomycetes bacterium]|jgi:hypothetical protein|nr:hypothetical protein [Planctomycetota bacterium]MDP6408413.1 integrin alpha [Planctomycetota bacterium]
MDTLRALFLPCFLVSTASSQETIDTLFGAAAGDRFGAAVAIVGDVDSDGRADFAAGAPGSDAAGTDAGRVTVYSGVDRKELFSVDGPAPGSRFGESVDGVGDIDLDGVDDLIAGAPGASRALVFSGVDGAILYDLAPATGGLFGTSVAGVGHADTDAWPDFAVGATVGNGVWVFSGRTGGLHWNAPGTARDLGGLGDVDQDGFDDLIAGDYTFDAYGGRAVVYSGLTGSVIRAHYGDPGWQDHLGKGATGVGDVDGDGVGDYGYGVPCNCFASHYVEVISGATGALIYWLSEYTIGWDVAGAGDLDLDGTPDILASVPGSVFAFSGADGSDLFAYGSAGMIDGGADVDGDGFPDILAGAEWDSTNGNAAGRVSLYTLGCPYPAPQNYCTALANTTGLPAAMGWQNSTSIQANNFRLLATDCPPHQNGVFFYGLTPTQVPFGEGNLCITGTMQRLSVVNTGSAGVPSYSLDFTDPPASSGQIHAGDTWYFSFWFRDPAGGPSGFNLADGLQASFCP